MPQQISVLIKTTGVLAIANGVVADPAGNLWNLPALVNAPSGGQVTVTATADGQNPNAPFPGSAVALTIETVVVGWLSAATPGQLTPIEFTTIFPEFANTSVGQINFWLGLAYQRMTSATWQDLLDDGVALYVAHNLSIQQKNQAQAANGGQPGTTVGPINNKSVDKASAGYDTGAGSVEGGGNYNLTNYGTRYLELVDIVGAQGVRQVGTGGCPPGTVSFPWVA